MAYEGFQLLSYDYEDIKAPERTLPRATISAVIAVIFIYILVAFGATMLVGADGINSGKGSCLINCRKTSSRDLWVSFSYYCLLRFRLVQPFNATLFSTGRLMETVAKKKDLPNIFVKENQANIPYYAIIIIAGLAAVFSNYWIFGCISRCSEFDFPNYFLHS